MRTSYIVRLLLIVAVGLAASGCGQKPPEQPKEPAEQTFVYQDLAPPQLMETLEKRYTVLKNFSSQPVQGTLSSRLSPFAKETLSGSLVLEKPNKVRLVLAKHHSPIRIDAICDGETFWVVFHEQKSIYTGRLKEPLNSRGERLPFKPIDILSAIFCTELSGDAAFEYRITYVEVPNPASYVVVVLNGDYPNKLYSKIWVDRSTLRILRHQLYKPDVGEIKLDAVFGDFVENTRHEIPRKIVMEWPGANTTLALDMGGVKINRPFENQNVFKYDYSDKGYGEIRVTGPEPPAARAGLQERDRGKGGNAPAVPGNAGPLGPGRPVMQPRTKR